MLQIDNTIISLDLLDEQFVCELSTCKGICCVEGDSGAPLEVEEIQIIEDLLPVIWDDLSEKSKDIIKKQGISYIDEDDEPVTSIVDGRECVFTYFDEKGICKCAIEKAFREGKTNFYKPISCHLYPVRLQKYNEFTAVNYHRWSVCECATVLGRNLKIPVYQFLKEPLVRKFGQDWFNELEQADTEIKNQKES